MKCTVRINEKSEEVEFEKALLHECGEIGVSASTFLKMAGRKYLIQKQHKIPPIGPERRGRPKKSQADENGFGRVEGGARRENKSQTPSVLSQGKGNGNG